MPQPLAPSLCPSLLDACVERAWSLTNLKLSGQPLTDPRSITSLCSLLTFQEAPCQIQYLDLSWCSLSPKSLAKVSEHFLDLSGSDYAKCPLKTLNLSYNALNCQETHKDFEYSESFISGICLLLTSGHVDLRHLDLSGMGLQGPNGRWVIKLAEALS